MTLQTEPETNEYFPTSLELYQYGDGKFQVLNQFTYLSPKFGAFQVPKGFITNAYSIPWPFTLAIKRDNSDNRAAVLHDYLFKHPTSEGRRKKLNLRTVNAIFKEAMRLSPTPMPRWKQRAIMTGLYAGSWAAWIKARLNDKNR